MEILKDFVKADGQGRITIPSTMRKRIGIGESDLLCVEAGTNQITIRKVMSPPLLLPRIADDLTLISEVFDANFLLCDSRRVLQAPKALQHLVQEDLSAEARRYVSSGIEYDASVVKGSIKLLNSSSMPLALLAPLYFNDQLVGALATMSTIPDFYELAEQKRFAKFIAKLWKGDLLNATATM